MKHYIINQRGKSHEYDNTPCEDAIMISEDGTVCCLADGVSNAAKGGDGAKVHVRETAKFLCTPEEKQFLRTAAPAVIRERISEFWRRLDEYLCKKYTKGTGSPADFSSTMHCAVDVGREIVLLHAGDGVIFGLPTGECGSVTILSGPDNSPNGAVYWSGHPAQKSRMRVIRIRKSDYAKVLLCTDGFSAAYYQPPFNLNIDLLEKLLQEEEFSAFVARSDKDHLEEGDDISCILLDIENAVKADAPVSAAVRYKDETPLFPQRPEAQAVPKPAPAEVSVKTGKREDRRNRSGKPRLKKTALAALILILAVQATGLILLAHKAASMQAEISATKQYVSALEEEVNGYCRERAARGNLKIS